MSHGTLRPRAITDTWGPPSARAGAAWTRVADSRQASASAATSDARTRRDDAGAGMPGMMAGQSGRVRSMNGTLATSSSPATSQSAEKGTVPKGVPRAR